MRLGGQVSLRIGHQEDQLVHRSSQGGILSSQLHSSIKRVLCCPSRSLWYDPSATSCEEHYRLVLARYLRSSYSGDSGSICLFSVRSPGIRSSILTKTGSRAVVPCTIACVSTRLPSRTRPVVALWPLISTSEGGSGWLDLGPEDHLRWWWLGVSL